ncbi:MAG: DUF4262 domain-containing protein [Leptolyngbyaceae cyanobacterium CSU_1_3]|nr:DUF4262 domain-containing protein [Leptolyngbyaceae cyanobacterium CSU_1_3]
MDSTEQKVVDDIAKYGWHAIKIMGDSEGPAFAYSIGLYETYHHPEIILFGLPLSLMHEIMNVISNEIKAGKGFQTGVRYESILDNYEVTFLAVNQADYAAYLGYALWYYQGTSFPVLQCVWPNRNGAFPWEAEADQQFQMQQPILGLQA